MELVRLCQSRFLYLSKVSMLGACSCGWKTVDCNNNARRTSDYSSHENSKVMQKLLNKKGPRGKRKWYSPPLDQSWNGKRKLDKHGVSEAQQTRARQLGHVLYEKIIDIINSGELCQEILNKQVLITSVKMHSTFEGVNVYWDSSRSDSVEVETLLQAKSGKLRSMLISYHVLGRIPPLTFVKDRSKGDLGLLEQLLEVADYGPDYVPSKQLNKGLKTQRNSIRWSRDEPLENPITNEPGHGKETSEFSSNIKEPGFSSLRNESWKCESSLQSENEITDDLSDLTSKFRSNVYGLPHGDLMKKVLTQRTKTKFQGGETEVISAKNVVDFRTKYLQSAQDKLRLKAMRDSTKAKEKLLQINPEDLRSLISSENEDFYQKEGDDNDDNDDGDDYAAHEDWDQK